MEKTKITLAEKEIKRLETEAPKTPYAAHMRPVEIKRRRQDIERARRELLNFAPGYETAALVELARRRGATNVKVTVKAGTYRQFEWTGKDGKKRFVGSAIGFAQAMGRRLRRDSKRVKI